MDLYLSKSICAKVNFMTSAGISAQHANLTFFTYLTLHEYTTLNSHSTIFTPCSFIMQVTIALHGFVFFIIQELPCLLGKDKRMLNSACF